MVDLDIRSTAARCTPAIVLGRGLTGLGTLRSLVHARIPAYVACPAGDLVTRSRWHLPTPGPVAWDGSIGPQACEILQGMPLDRAVLIPGADNAALWLADLAQSELSQRFRVCTSSRETLEILQDKARFGAYLANTSIPHPRTFSIASQADIDAIPFDDLDRVFIKPADSQHFSEALDAKGIWARDAREFGEIWRKLDGQGLKVIAQEYVPGSSSDHYFIDGFRDRYGNLTGLFARRRVRIFPPDFGNSSYCHSIRLEDVQGALDSLTVLLSRLNYRGIFSAEFKQDSRNRQFRILEINTRAWWYVEFAARCGVNVCKLAFEDANAMPVTAAPRNYPVDVGCVNLSGDIKSVLSQTAAMRGSLRKILGQWMHAHYHVFKIDDPMPGLSVFWQILRGRIMKRIRRLLGER